MPYFVGEVGNDLCQIVQLGQHRGTLGLVQYCCRILLERSVQSICILCLEENQKPRWCAGQVFLDCIVDVISLSAAVKILDPVFTEYLTKKQAEGKHYNVALSHATKKLVRLIYALQKSGKAYLAIT